MMLGLLIADVDSKCIYCNWKCRVLFVSVVIESHMMEPRIFSQPDRKDCLSVYSWHAHVACIAVIHSVCWQGEWRSCDVVFLFKRGIPFYPWMMGSTSILGNLHIDKVTRATEPNTVHSSFGGFLKWGTPSYHPKVVMINRKTNGFGYPYFRKLPFTYGRIRWGKMDSCLCQCEDPSLHWIPAATFSKVYDLNETTGYLNNYGLKNVPTWDLSASGFVLGSHLRLSTCH